MRDRKDRRLLHTGYQHSTSPFPHSYSLLYTSPFLLTINHTFTLQDRVLTWVILCSYTTIQYYTLCKLVSTHFSTPGAARSSLYSTTRYKYSYTHNIRLYCTVFYVYHNNYTLLTQQTPTIKNTLHTLLSRERPY